MAKKRTVLKQEYKNFGHVKIDLTELGQLLSSSTFQKINTMDLKAKLKYACQGFTIQQQIDAVESLGKELRRTNSIRINKKIKSESHFDDDREDLRSLRG